MKKTPVKNPEDKDLTLLRALALFVNITSIEHGMLIDTPQLLVARPEGNFTPLQPDEPLTGQPLYFAFQLNPEPLSGASDKKQAHNIEENLATLEKRWHEIIRAARHTPPDSHFDVKCSNGIVYISVEPIIEQPQLAFQFLKSVAETEGRRDFLALGLAAAAGDIVKDATDRHREHTYTHPDKSLIKRRVQQTVDIGEGMAGGSVGAEAMKNTLKAAFNYLRKKDAKWFHIMDETQWREFVGGLRAQMKGRHEAHRDGLDR